MTTPDGVSVTIHNAFGQTVELRDGNGNVTRHAYNADGSLVRTEDGGMTVANRYDNLQRLIETVDARGQDQLYRCLGRRLSRWWIPTGRSC